MDHPSVELNLPLDGKTHSIEIPQETTLFFWNALVPGTADRLSPVESDQGYNQLCVARELVDLISWKITFPDDHKPLLDEVYRRNGYRGCAWWIACDPIELPATIEVTFESIGECPTIEGKPVVLWTTDGEPIEWGTTIKSTIELVPSSTPASQFPTRQELLWNRHTVYVPNWTSTGEESNLESSSREPL
ncbi:hypothetical protein [Natronoarchaeum rubrum]|uniref:hypothetical protein n=1 Tax=Natronoarchaeum rubrum TaxID=755311 RepID=UPI00211246DD|nr:hypothetical protein [Natronoarchaeum rubrum]